MVIVSVTMRESRASELIYWEYINVDIDVQENGDMWVTEEQKYVFTAPNMFDAPHSIQRYRWLPLDKVDGIDRVEVSEDGKNLHASTGIENDQLWIKWTHAPNPPESHTFVLKFRSAEFHTFVLKYRVEGGLHINDDGDQVSWKAIFKKRERTIQRAMVTVHLPNKPAMRVSKSKSSGVPTTVREIDDQTVEFVSKQPVPPRYSCR
jgi:hypothetical protein